MFPDLNSGKVIVHFGPPKTGTSSIQESLYRHLADPHFHYIDLGASNASYGVATAFKADPSSFRVHARRKTALNQLRQLRQSCAEKLEAELETAGPKTAILSGEAISGLSESEVRELCDALAKRRGAVTAVGYARRPKDFMESLFQQRIRGGMREFDMSALSTMYRGRFEKFDAVLGRPNVQVWLFDPAAFPGKCVVQDFCSRLGISFRPGDVIRANEGLSLPALALLFAYRKFGPSYGAGPTVLRENKLLVERVRNLAGPKMRLHSSLVAPVIEQARADIEWMEERLGASLTENLATHDDVAIRSEEDLLAFSPEALQWLAGEVGGEAARRLRPGASPVEVADAMQQLRTKLADADEKLLKVVARAGGTADVESGQGEALDLDELIRRARESALEPGTLTDADARKLMRAVFRQVRGELEAAPQGEFAVSALGVFRIRQRKREKNGREKSIRRIVFRPRAKTRNKKKAG